jgi:predicted acetyltransferase
MPVEIRTITDEEIAAFRDSMVGTFGDDTDGDPGGPERTRATVDRSQAWAAFDRGQIVATAGTFNLAIGVPGGGTLPMAGLTMVSVKPTHRRRGILRELMARHLDDARARSYAISGLWASEAGIYGRFGYGIAAECYAVEIARADSLTVALGAELDELEWIDEARARQVLPGIYARATANRPGALRRSEVWWRERRFLEAAFVRNGASKRRHVLARRGDEIVGYVVYRQRSGYTEGVFTGTCEINELFAIDTRAEATLWKFALAMDLFPTVTWWNMPVDDVLPYLVNDPRRVRRRITDNMWLRIEDVPTSLAARRYPADGGLRFAIDGTTSWELTVDDGRGHCVASSRAPDLRFDRQTLGALYLGGVSAVRLARAGLIHGDLAAIATADRLFASPVAPWCPEIF